MSVPVNGSDIQVDGGNFTRIHNTILEVLAVARLTATEYRAVCLLLRKTYGWSKKEDAISLTQWAEGTNTDKGQITRALDALVEKNVIYRKIGPRKTVYIYGFNKYLETWNASLFERTEGRKRGRINDRPNGQRLTVGSKDIDRRVKEFLTVGSTTKEKKDTTKDTSPNREMFGALANLCRLDMRLKRGQLARTTQSLLKSGYTVADIETFEGWWKRNDWRGRRGQVPTLGQVVDNILQATQAGQRASPANDPPAGLTDEQAEHWREIHIPGYKTAEMRMLDKLRAQNEQAKSESN